jgi:hypothetical protein
MLRPEARVTGSEPAHATRVTVALNVEADQVRLLIANNGTGPPTVTEPPGPAGPGLRRMRERAAAVRATLVQVVRAVIHSSLDECAVFGSRGGGVVGSVCVGCGGGRIRCRDRVCWGSVIQTHCGAGEQAWLPRTQRRRQPRRRAG